MYYSDQEIDEGIKKTADLIKAACKAKTESKILQAFKKTCSGNEKQKQYWIDMLQYYQYRIIEVVKKEFPVFIPLDIQEKIKSRKNKSMEILGYIDNL